MNENVKITNSSTLSDQPERLRRAAARRRLQRGASLIEIMVVLVVLLIGIFLAIRIFPVGFATIAATGNRSIAQRLASGNLEAVRTNSVNLPQGVQQVFDNDGDGTLDVITNADPDDLNGIPDPATGDPSTNPYFQDVNKFRYIRGEGVRISLAAVGQGGASYTLKYGPIYMDPRVGDKETVPSPTDTAQRNLFGNYLALRGAPLVGRERESAGAGTSTDPRGRYVGGFVRSLQSYLIDYGDDSTGAFIMFPVRRATTPARNNPTRSFRITYTYESANGIESGEAVIVVPDSTTGYPFWQPIPLPTGGQAQDILQGSETVSREFERVPASGNFDSDDPYQYKLVSSNIAGPSGPTFANFGVLSFNPSGATYTERTPYGERPFTAYVDYAVLDWHIIREDREVPYALPNNIAGASLVPIRVTLNNIKRLGDSESDNTIYNGLYRDASNPIDIQVFDLSRSAEDATTGALPLTQGEIDNGTLLPDDTRDYYVDIDRRGGTYGSGTIFINTARINRGAQLRILYKADGDWAVALKKAYTNYEVARNPNTSTEANYPLRGVYDKFGKAGVGVNAEMRFPLVDLNNSFLVTIQYLTAGGQWKRLAPVQMTASNKLEAPAGGVDETRYDSNYAFIRVNEFIQGALQKDEFADSTAWQVVGTVQGVSVKTRVIWKDTGNVNEKWHVMDMDSNLTPAPQ